MLRKLISISLVAVMLSVTAFAATDIVGLNAAYAEEESAGALTVENGKLFINGYGVQGSLSLTSAKDATAKVITAVFDESDELINATISEDIALTAGNAVAYPISINATEEEAKQNSFEFYLWEKGTLAPLSNSVTAKATYGWSGTDSYTAFGTTPAVATEADLDGTYAGYYMIKSPEDLAWFANNLATEEGANAVLCNDIYLNYYADKTGAFDEDWYATRQASSNLILEAQKAKKWDTYLMKMKQKGTFDGNYNAICGLYATGPSTSDSVQYNGLFREISGNVKNLEVLGGYVVASKGSATATSGYSGVLAATIKEPAIIDNVKATGSVVTQSGRYSPRAGGLVGIQTDLGSSSSGRTTIKNCVVDVDVDYKKCGTTVSTQGLANSTNVGTGGILGMANRRLTITNCVSKGDVYAPYSQYVGGVVGAIKFNNAVIKETTAEGNVTGYYPNQTGKFVGGFNSGVKIDNVTYSTVSAIDALEICKGGMDTTFAPEPTASPVAGEVEAGTSVKLTASRCKIYYAIGDGEYQEYTGTIAITEPTTIKAYAEFVGSTKTTRSAEAIFEYTIAGATE